MKPYTAIIILAAAFCAHGCASRQDPLVLDHASPSPGSTSPLQPHGTLIVFSAYDVHAHFNDLPYRRFYSDYRIYSEDGKFLESVHNQSESPLDGPREVGLPPGNYRVRARANGYGTVTVPVKIEAHRTTRVHFDDGRAQWQAGATPE